MPTTRPPVRASKALRSSAISRETWDRGEDMGCRWLTVWTATSWPWYSSFTSPGATKSPLGACSPKVPEFRWKVPFKPCWLKISTSRLSNSRPSS